MDNAILDPAHEELIVLVDNLGKPIGSAPKLASHHDNTPLHLAFSVFIFSSDGRVLVTQRANSKKVWPGVWTGSCCGHPFPHESMEKAIERRTEYELGIGLQNIRVILPDYRYKTPLFKGVIEHEVCPLYFAETRDKLQLNPFEVEDYKWLNWDDFVAQALADSGDLWSWWCKDQLKQLTTIPDLILK